MTEFVLRVLVLLSVVLFKAVTLGSSNDLEQTYGCNVCRDVVSSTTANITFQEACYTVFSMSYCDKIYGASDIMSSSRKLLTHGHGSICSRHCDKWNDRKNKVSEEMINVRISKAMGPRGYNMVRITLVTNSSYSDNVDGSLITDSPLLGTHDGRKSASRISSFSHSQFRYRWTQFHLTTALVEITPGSVTNIRVAGQEMSLLLPKEDEGVRGIIIADPCISSAFVWCKFEDKFQMSSRLAALLDAAHQRIDDISYWQVLGDNLYDRLGDITFNWFNGLSMETKSKIFLAVPGNHDVWVNGVPQAWVKEDQQLHGFMQFYGQDVVASLSSFPYDFSVDPDASEFVGAEKGLPHSSNFFTYNKIGNTAMIGFSGAHNYSQTKGMLIDACKWAIEVNPAIVMLLGHWNEVGMGSFDTTVPDVYGDMMKLEECAPIAKKIKYAVGHEHCNKVVLPDVGFMVGGMGMEPSLPQLGGCVGEFGIPVFDTTGGLFRVLYFPISDEKGLDNFQITLDCFKNQGVSNCYHLATEFASIPLDSMN